MSCNGCRVLRKGCSESCVLRPCLQWIESAEAQGHATVFVAKFFGRSGLMNFVSSVPESQRPGLFQSLLFEACGRTVDPVNGAVGLLWSGNWRVCQAAVETVLRGGALRPAPDLRREAAPNDHRSRGSSGGQSDAVARASKLEAADLDLSLSPTDARGPGTPSEEGSVTTTSSCDGDGDATDGDVAPARLLNLFV